MKNMYLQQHHKICGLLCDGDTTYLNELVNDYIHDLYGPPTVLPQICGNIINITHLVTLMSRMVAQLMKNEVTPRLLIECDISINISLTVVHKFDIALHGTADC